MQMVLHDTHTDLVFFTFILFHPSRSRKQGSGKRGRVIGSVHYNNKLANANHKVA